MNIRELAVQRRSIRKFQPEPISRETLEALVDITRLYPSGGNLQPIRYAIITEPELADQIFADLRWAMYLPDYTIASHERPTAYIVLLRDDKISHGCKYDVGAASTLLMLAAAEQGIATCPIGNYHAGKLAALLELSDEIKPELVIAMGYPAQESRVMDIQDSIRYTQDENGNFLVPKYKLKDVLVR